MHASHSCSSSHRPISICVTWGYGPPATSVLQLCVAGVTWARHSHMGAAVAGSGGWAARGCGSAPPCCPHLQTGPHPLGKTWSPERGRRQQGQPGPTSQPVTLQLSLPAHAPSVKWGKGISNNRDVCSQACSWLPCFSCVCLHTGLCSQSSHLPPSILRTQHEVCSQGTAGKAINNSRVKG
jgi:hypothetical protein